MSLSPPLLKRGTTIVGDGLEAVPALPSKADRKEALSVKAKFLALTLVLLLLAGCAAQEQSPVDPAPQPENTEQAAPDLPEEPPQPEGEMEPEPEPDPRTEAIEAVLSRMTLEEKVGQLFFVRCPAAGAAGKAEQYHLGGYLLFGRDFKDSADNWLTQEQFTAAVAAYQEAASIPLLIGVDEEGGTVARASRNPNLFPAKRKSPQAVYAQGGMDAVVQDTLAVNGTLLLYGINVNFAPVADVSTTPGDFIYDRAFGQDAAATAEYIRSAVTAMNTAGIGSVLKHFPGYGSNVDTHTGIAVDERPYDQFTAEDFLPFSAGIEAGAGAVLVSHNIVTCMDDTLPASLSPQVHRVLREELGFTGVILTDDLAMDAVEAYAEDGSVAVLAVLAGNDMIVTTDFETQIPQVIAAVEDGTIDESAVDEAVVRILGWKYDLGLLEAVD